MRFSRALGLLTGVLLGACGALGEERTEAPGEPLPDHVVMRLGDARFRQPDFAVQVAFSPDGKRIASIASDNNLTIWEAPSGKRIVRTGHQKFRGYEFEALAYSGDGRLIAAQFKSSTQLLDASTGAVVRNVGARIYPVALALSVDGGVLAAAELGGDLYAWDTSNGKRLLTAKAYDSNRRPTLAMSPDGTRLWTFLRGAGARLWSLETGKEEAPVRPEMKESVAGAFSGDGRRLALADGKGVIRVYEADAEPVELGTLDGGVVTLVFLSDGDTLSAVGGAGVLARWSLTSRARRKDVALRSFRALRDEGAGGYAPVIAVSQDGRHVARPGATIELWDAATGEPLSPAEGGSGRPCGVVLSPDEQYVATGRDGGTVELWSLTTGTCVARRTVGEEDDYVCPAGFCATGEALIARGEGGALLVLKVPDLSLLRSFDNAAAGDIGLLDGGRMAVVGAVWEEGLALLDLREGSIIQRPEGEPVGGFTQVVVSPDQTLVACTPELQRISSHVSYPIYVHSVQTGRRLWDIPASLSWRGTFGFSPDSAYVISEDWEGTETRWCLATGEPDSEEEVLDDDGEPVAEVDVELSDEGVLTVRRHGNREVLWKVNTACGEFCGSAYTGDGRRLITGMEDSTLLVWNLGASAVAPPRPFDAPMEEVWALLGSSNTWDVSRASATIVARGDDAVGFLRGRLSSLPPDGHAPSPLEWTPEGLARIRGIWALGRIGTPAAHDLLHAVASSSEAGREARAARPLLERKK